MQYYLDDINTWDNPDYTGIELAVPFTGNECEGSCQKERSITATRDLVGWRTPSYTRAAAQCLELNGNILAQLGYL